MTPVVSTETSSPAQQHTTTIDAHEPPAKSDVHEGRTPGMLLGIAFQQAWTAQQDTLTGLAMETAAIRERLDAVVQQVARNDRESAVIEDLHRRYVALNEEFYQKEVLIPVFSCLIALADRCREQARHSRAREMCRHDATMPCEGAASVARARKADRIEIEHVLAGFGVLPYRENEVLFNARTQKALGTVPTSDRAHSGAVADRLQPGYSRDGRVIRPELVSVYIYATSVAKGAQA